MFYTGIGSRETPDSVLGIMEDAAYRLAAMGWVLRSGKAGGADEAFQKGMQRFAKDLAEPEALKLAEIYTPWAKFKNANLSDMWDTSLPSIDAVFPHQIKSREGIVGVFHPAADYMKAERPGAYALHSRNVHQIMGMDLEAKRYSSFVLFYTKEDKNGNPKGGTATAVNLARSLGVRTLNLLHQENQEKLELFLVSMEKKRGLRT